VIRALAWIFLAVVVALPFYIVFRVGQACA